MPGSSQGIPDNTKIDTSFESAGVSTSYHHDDLQESTRTFSFLYLLVAYFFPGPSNPCGREPLLNYLKSVAMGIDEPQVEPTEPNISDQCSKSKSQNCISKVAYS